MEMCLWFDRYIEKNILSAVKSRPVILLTGARQTGKSSLLQKMFSDLEYITLDSIQYAEQAKENPDYFLSQFKQAVILPRSKWC